MSPLSVAYGRSPALPRGFAYEGQGELSRRLYLLPSGIVGGQQAAAAIVGGHGWPIAGGSLAFTSVAVLWREAAKAWMAMAPYAELMPWSEGEGEEVGRFVGSRVLRIGSRRAAWAGLDMSQPVIMGIVNATPDSFSDGGDTLDPNAAIQRAISMVEAGAGIIDVGGESTRPGAAAVGEDAEMARVLPVISALAQRGVTVSVDTRHARVMGAAVEAGARIINDVTALEGPGALEVAARSGAAVCLMHMQGEPQTMQAHPHYDCAPLDVYDYLADRIAVCDAAGIDRSRIAVDPGIGFGKSVDHNAQILAALALYHGLGCPVLLGVSRKSFIGRLSRDEAPKARLPGSLAAAQAGVDAGAQILRVHDVAETAQAVAVWKAIRAAG